MTIPDLPNVSRETLARLHLYADALRKWNPKINLVSKATLENLWNRHIVDSAQLMSLAPQSPRIWADLGSGGGFPGLVAAILMAEKTPDPIVTMVESDQRKCAFLRSVLRETRVSATVVAKRIEDIESLRADVISARALADLTTLLDFGERHMAPNATLLFQKGKTWSTEVEEAQRKWRFECDVVKSKTSDQSVVLRLSGVSRV